MLTRRLPLTGADLERSGEQSGARQGRGNAPPVRRIDDPKVVYSASGLGRRLIQDRVQGGVEQLRDQRRRRVMAD